MARQVCVSFVFRAFVVAMILASTIATALDNPYLSATRRAQLDQLNTAFGGLFLLEAANPNPNPNPNPSPSPNPNPHPNPLLPAQGEL